MKYYECDCKVYDGIRNESYIFAFYMISFIMKMKFLSVLCILIITISCKKNQEQSDVDINISADSLEVKQKDVSKIKYTDYILDSRAENAIIHWESYKKLEDVVSSVKKADLSFFYKNNKEVKELLVNLKQNIPLEVNSPSILSRISALETKLLKLESLANLSTTSKAELLANIQDFLVAFSNLNLQMNKKIENDNIIIEKP
ncbi:hypothetical protein EV196_109165 [Mariniflexile fucanivorans]|uniref:Uncharacterized protein n=1 Tax=Mariniflexile fucanivorans TaxID=264023 RepID=A0A4R1RCP3_9FLAO|nr:hypothetical protein [Mariniflexile fucanivorans]TCL63539.1 hypothetical protein EV196_109165 [Mariniflexile fucanivorans]